MASTYATQLANQTLQPKSRGIQPLFSYQGDKSGYTYNQSTGMYDYQQPTDTGGAGNQTIYDTSTGTYKPISGINSQIQLPNNTAIPTSGANYDKNYSPDALARQETARAEQKAAADAKAANAPLEGSAGDITNWEKRYREQAMKSFHPYTAEPTLPYAESLIANRGMKPQSYYDSVKEGMMKTLRDQYMGPQGVGYQVASNISGGGRLDSPVGTKQLQEAFARPYEEAIQGASRDVFQQQQNDTQAFNTWSGDLLNAAKATDSGNALEAYKATETAMSRIDDMIKGMLSGTIQLTAEDHQNNLAMINAAIQQDQLAQGLATTPIGPEEQSDAYWKGMTRQDAIANIQAGPPDFQQQSILNWNAANPDQVPIETRDFGTGR